MKITEKFNDWLDTITYDRDPDDNDSIPYMIMAALFWMLTGMSIAALCQEPWGIFWTTGVMGAVFGAIFDGLFFKQPFSPARFFVQAASLPFTLIADTATSSYSWIRKKIRSISNKRKSRSFVNSSWKIARGGEKKTGKVQTQPVRQRSGQKVKDLKKLRIWKDCLPEYIMEVIKDELGRGIQSEFTSGELKKLGMWEELETIDYKISQDGKSAWAVVRFGVTKCVMDQKTKVSDDDSASWLIPMRFELQPHARLVNCFVYEGCSGVNPEHEIEYMMHELEQDSGNLEKFADFKPVAFEELVKMNADHDAKLSLVSSDASPESEQVVAATESN